MIKINFDIVKNFCLEEWATIRELAVSAGKSCASAATKGAQSTAKFSKEYGKQLYLVLTDVYTHRRVAATVIGVVAVFIVFLWQFFAYSLPQPVFVIVNIVLFGVVLLYVCLMMFKMKKAMATLLTTIDESTLARKKKDQEVAQLKSELLDLKMLSRKQMSFGKNSQALIDAVKKNKQEQREGEMRGQFLLRSLSQCYNICGGVVYMLDDESGKYEFAGEYALSEEPTVKVVDETDGLIGQVLREGKPVQHHEIDSEYLTTVSGLGRTSKLSLYVLPVKKDGKIVAIIEITSFTKLAVVDVWKDIDTLLLTD